MTTKTAKTTAKTSTGKAAKMAATRTARKRPARAVKNVPAKSASTLPDTGIETFPLSQLVLSPLNPRQSVTDEEIADLSQSIQTCGLLQSLIGLKDGKKIGIVGGGRRLRALQKLVAEKAIKRNYSVPVRIADNETQAIEWANAENNAREAFNPAQEVRAYRTMAENGMEPDRIAIAFAKTVRHVKGRLRLASLHDCILDALDKGEITLDVAAAYTVTEDQDRQEAVFLELKDS